MKYNVLIADDYPMARKAIKSLLDEDKSFVIVGEAPTGLEAIQLCKEFEPDVVLMDINMPELDGLEATKKIKQLYPNIKVVILTVSDDASDLFTAIQYGAQGYLLKNMDPNEWLNYLYALLDESSQVSKGIADKLIHQFKSGKNFISNEVNSLSEREQEILSLVALGETNRQIANKLYISENTVKNHIKNILEKLSLENRVQLTVFAVRNGLLSQNSQSQR